MESPESSVEVSIEPQRRKRPRWRLRVLVVLAALAIILFLISQLEPEQAKKSGPVIEAVYLVFNPTVEIELTENGKQFIAEMATMGGPANRIAPDRGFLGVFGSRERFIVNFSGANLDDTKLDWPASNHADRIDSLGLAVTAPVRTWPSSRPPRRNFGSNDRHPLPRRARPGNLRFILVERLGRRSSIAKEVGLL
jgi:hypothetical protein